MNLTATDDVFAVRMRTFIPGPACTELQHLDHKSAPLVVWGYCGTEIHRACSRLCYMQPLHRACSGYEYVQFTLLLGVWGRACPLQHVQQALQVPLLLLGGHPVAHPAHACNNSTTRTDQAFHACREYCGMVEHECCPCGECEGDAICVEATELNWGFCMHPDVYPNAKLGPYPGCAPAR